MKRAHLVAALVLSAAQLLGDVVLAVGECLGQTGGLAVATYPIAGGR